MSHIWQSPCDGEPSTEVPELNTLPPPATKQNLLASLVQQVEALTTIVQGP